jgi:predicted RNase H-like nuclease (RuvC/YqgF family)
MQPREKPRTQSATRASQKSCCSYKSLSQAEKIAENLDRKYKRLRKTTNELVNKNTVYQNDIFKAEKRIETMEGRFNSLVEDFQRYINEKEHELAKKDETIRNLERQNKNEEQFDHICMDDEERNLANRLYQSIHDDFSIQQDRDEVMLDTIEKYIYDKKQPNVAFGVWEAADFNH